MFDPEKSPRCFKGVLSCFLSLCGLFPGLSLRRTAGREKTKARCSIWAALAFLIRRGEFGGGAGVGEPRRGRGASCGHRP